MSSAIASFGLDGSRICRPTTQALRSLYPTGQSLFSFLQERSFLLKTSAANARTTCNFRYGLSHWCSLAFGYSKPVPLHICMSLAPPNLVTLVSLRLDPPMKLMKQLEHRTILHRQPTAKDTKIDIPGQDSSCSSSHRKQNWAERNPCRKSQEIEKIETVS
jgi:hypothetical protein